TPSLRNDPDLRARFPVELTSPSTADILYQLQRGTGLRISVDPDLDADSPEYGMIHMSSTPAWSMMEFVAQRQKAPARWQKTQGGWHLSRIATSGDRLGFWLAGAAILLAFPIFCLVWGDSAKAPAREAAKPREAAAV